MENRLHSAAGPVMTLQNGTGSALQNLCRAVPIGLTGDAMMTHLGGRFRERTQLTWRRNSTLDVSGLV